MNFDSLIGPGYTLFSRKAESQLSINVWRERVQTDQGTNPFVMYKSFGTLPYIALTAGIGRGMFELNGHEFIVVGNTIYDYIGGVLNGTAGPINNDGLPVQFAASQDTLMIYSGGLLLRLNGGNLSVPVLSFVPLGITWVKNYFVAISDNASQFFFSTDDGATWPADQVQTAEADATALMACASIHQQLVLIGQNITQWFYVTGDPDAPFSPVDSGVLRSGTLAPNSVKALGESLYWVENSKEGTNSIVKTNGYAIQTVSNNYIGDVLQRVSFLTEAGTQDAIGMAFKKGDHEFYRVTFPSADITLEYHANQDEWECPAWFDWLHTEGNSPFFDGPGLEGFHKHRAMSFVSDASGKILALDHSNGFVYRMSQYYYYESGFPLKSLRRTPHIVQENKNIAFGRLDLGAETGVGLVVSLWLNNYTLAAAAFATALAAAVVAATVTADQALILQKIYDGTPHIPLSAYPDATTMAALGFYPWGDDPVITLRYSNDGGSNYSAELVRSMGRASVDGTQVYWNRLGKTRDRVWELAHDAPCKLAITGAYLEAEEMLS